MPSGLEVLARANFEIARYCRLRARSPWSLQFSETDGVRLGVVLEGTLTLALPDGTVEELNRGDAYILREGLAYRIGSDEHVVPVNGHAVFNEAGAEIAEYPSESTDHDLLAISASIKLDQPVTNLLAETVPPISLMRSGQPWGAKVGLLVSMLGEEAVSTELGSHTMRQRLTQLLFIHMLRQVIARADVPQGWLAGAMDPSLQPVLAAVQASPGEPWTVRSLAEVALMSRSAFAQRFTSVVGIPPMSFVRMWRAHVAGQMVQSTNTNLHAVAAHVGYGSNSALSRSFKRLTGVPPSSVRASAGSTAQPDERNSHADVRARTTR